MAALELPRVRGRRGGFLDVGLAWILILIAATIAVAVSFYWGALTRLGTQNMRSHGTPAVPVPQSANSSTIQFSAVGACGPAIIEYRNSRYGYTISAPKSWRLAKEITEAVNAGIPTKNAESVYFTDLNCEDEARISATVPQFNSLSGSPAVDNAIDEGAIFVVFPNPSDGGLSFALAASKLRFDHTNVAPVEDVTIEVLDSGVSAVRYLLRGSLAAQPLATVFVSDGKAQENPFGNTIRGFDIQAGQGKLFSEKSFASFYRSFRYSP